MTEGTTCGILGHSRRPGGSSRVHLPRVAAVLSAGAVLSIVVLGPAIAAGATATALAIVAASAGLLASAAVMADDHP